MSTNLSGNTLTLGSTSLNEGTLKVLNSRYYVSGSGVGSANLSGNTLTLGNTSLNEETLRVIMRNYYVPDNCTVDTTVILDGIECICVATGVTIQGSSLTRIAVDKNYDLGYYNDYRGTVQDGAQITERNRWRWGGYETKLGNTSEEIGYGLQNTINCLANPANYTNGSSTSSQNYPLMWIGVKDFRASHSDKWFVPSLNELYSYVYKKKSLLTFDGTTGDASTIYFWSSFERDSIRAWRLIFSNGNGITDSKGFPHHVRLCSAF